MQIQYKFTTGKSSNLIRHTFVWTLPSQLISASSDCSVHYHWYFQVEDILGWTIGLSLIDRKDYRGLICCLSPYSSIDWPHLLAGRIFSIVDRQRRVYLIQVDSFLFSCSMMYGHGVASEALLLLASCLPRVRGCSHNDYVIVCLPARWRSWYMMTLP